MHPQGCKQQHCTHLCEQLPCPADGLLLEVVPKRPVSQHLKECVVVHILANIIQVIVLATCTWTMRQAPVVNAELVIVVMPGRGQQHLWAEPWCPGRCPAVVSSIASIAQQWRLLYSSICFADTRCCFLRTLKNYGKVQQLPHHNRPANSTGPRLLQQTQQLSLCSTTA